MLLGSLGGLDTALREHFSGFRSHAVLLAALPAIGATAAAFSVLNALLLRVYRRRAD